MNDEIKEILDYLKENSKKDEATKQADDILLEIMLSIRR